MIPYVKPQMKLMDIVPVAMMDMKLITMVNVFPLPHKESVTHFVLNLKTMSVQNVHQAHISMKTISVNLSILTALNLTHMKKNASNATQVMPLFQENVKLIQHILLTILIVQNFQMVFVWCVLLDIILKKMENVQLLTHCVQLSIKLMDNVKAVLLVTLYNQVSAYHLNILLKIPTVHLSTLIILVKYVQKDFSSIWAQIYVNFQTHYVKLLMIQMALVSHATVDMLLVENYVSLMKVVLPAYALNWLMEFVSDAPQEHFWTHLVNVKQ